MFGWDLSTHGEGGFWNQAELSLNTGSAPFGTTGDLDKPHRPPHKVKMAESTVGVSLGHWEQVSTKRGGVVVLVLKTTEMYCLTVWRPGVSNQVWAGA